MRLSRIEYIVMNNPMRRWIQKVIEFRLLSEFIQKHHIDLNGGVILDAGCGSGYSTELIGTRYNPKELLAFDIMPEQIELAKKRYGCARFFVGSITEIDSPSNKYDAVFVFGVLHHVPEWKRALREIYRVLKPKGVLLIEEVDKTGVDFVDKYMGFFHPSESRFDWPQLVKGMEEAGFHIVEDSRIILSIFHAYLCKKP